MNDILFLIIALLLLSLITGLRMLVHIWGKKYRYKNPWDLVDSEEDRIRERKRKIKRYRR